MSVGVDETGGGFNTAPAAARLAGAESRERPATGDRGAVVS